jgi:tetratricopeptide (TPR) repeat protein
MSRLLRRAALATTAAAAVAAAMRDPSQPQPFTGRFLGPSSAYDAAKGHLGLARAHQKGLPELNALLTPEAFLLDSAHALGAGAIRFSPLSGEQGRVMLDDAREAIESGGEVEATQELRLKMALVYAEDGRFEDALDDLARLAAERQSDPRPRLCAAVISYLVGLHEEGGQWLVGVPEDVRQKNDYYLRRAILAAAVGGAPCGGFEGLVGFTAWEVIDMGLKAKHLDGDISLLKKMLLSGLMWHLVANKYEKYCEGRFTGVRPKNALDVDDIISRKPSDPNADDAFFVVREQGRFRRRADRKDLLFPPLRGYCLDAWQALLSAVLLRAQPLSGERLRAARRTAERDLARAVKDGDRSVAADLRLLLALFAVRDGRFDDALERYAEVARGDPADARPRELACLLCAVAGRPAPDELERFALGTADLVELFPLKDELMVAAVLGGALPDCAEEVESMPWLLKEFMRMVVLCAWRRAGGGAAGQLNVAIFCLLGY